MPALEEILSIFPDDEVQIGDIVSAMWPPKLWASAVMPVVETHNRR